MRVEEPGSAEKLTGPPLVRRGETLPTHLSLRSIRLKSTQRPREWVSAPPSKAWT